MPKANYKKMQKGRVVELVNFLVREKGLTTDEAFSKLMQTKTYSCLMNSKKDFYWKSTEELKYLLIMELSGKVKEWENQSHTKYAL